MTIKLDLEKANDMLNWDYIRMVLGKFGFYPSQINLIMECITSSSFSVLVNGELMVISIHHKELDIVILYLPTFLFYA